MGAKHVLAVNTGTTALHIALDAFGIKDGDEVIVPSLTFCASIQVITALGARPVFCEIHTDNLNMDVSDVKKKLLIRLRPLCLSITAARRAICLFMESCRTKNVPVREIF